MGSNTTSCDNFSSLLSGAEREEGADDSEVLGGAGSVRIRPGPVMLFFSLFDVPVAVPSGRVKGRKRKRGQVNSLG